MRRLALFLLIIPSIYLLFTSLAQATDYQQCTTSTTCTIGEFLYDDAYSPLTGQSCTFNAKYPDGTAFITSQAMTGRADGWYSYDATLGTTEGIYSATICCTPSSGTMCLDKSFEVKAPAATAPTVADIWSYSGRTLTSYGTLVADIWNYSTRSLTTVGALVSDIWGYSGRTLTSFGSLVSEVVGTGSTSTSTISASPATLSSVVAEQKIQRELLEKLVNAPVVSLSLDDGVSIPDLQTKLDESKKQAGILYDTISSAKSRLMVLDGKWSRLSADAISDEITAVANLLKDQALLANLTKSWNTETMTTLNKESLALGSTLSSLLTSSSLNKSSLPPVSLTASLEHLSAMEEVLGDSTNDSSDKTLFGYLASVSERNSSLEGEGQKLSALLENLNGQGESNASRAVNAIKDRVLTLNEYPGGESLAEPAKVAGNPKLNLKNMLFSLQALVSLNRQVLAMNVGDPIRSLWLEEGSIIFRAVITNPSTIISQSVPLKFYLPRELKTEDIITLDPSLSTTYDSTEEALYASGTYNLSPGETKLVFIEVEDIWKLTDQEIQTLRTQANDLIKPLEKTTYYSQGITLKSDIDVTLDKVLLNTGKAVTPENRIRAYREAKLELAKVTANMNRLQDLVAQAGGTGSLFGFVGGVQTVAVWGIILVVVAGFVFLSLYFKKLQPVDKLIQESAPPADNLAHNKVTHLTPLTRPQSRPAWQMPAIITIVVIVTAISTVVLTRVANKPSTPPVINQVIVSPAPSAKDETSASPSATPLRNDIEIKSEKSILGETSDITSAILTVPSDSTVNIRNKPSSTADIIMAVSDTQDVYVFGESGDWTQIGFTQTDEPKAYWVHSKFISTK